MACLRKRSLGMGKPWGLIGNLSIVLKSCVLVLKHPFADKLLSSCDSSYFLQTL